MAAMERMVHNKRKFQRKQIQYITFRIFLLLTLMMLLLNVIDASESREWNMESMNTSASNYSLFVGTQCKDSSTYRNPLNNFPCHAHLNKCDQSHYEKLSLAQIDELIESCPLSCGLCIPGVELPYAYNAHESKALDSNDSYSFNLSIFNIISQNFSSSPSTSPAALHPSSIQPKGPKSIFSNAQTKFPSATPSNVPQSLPAFHMTSSPTLPQSLKPDTYPLHSAYSLSVPADTYNSPPTSNPSFLPSASSSPIPSSSTLLSSSSTNLKSSTNDYIQGSVNELCITFNHMESMDDETIKRWEQGTDTYYERYYKSGAAPLGVTNLEIKTNFIEQILIWNGYYQKVTVCYSQTLKFATDDPSIEVEEVAYRGLLLGSERNLYLQTLRGQGSDSFDSITQVSPIDFDRSVFSDMEMGVSNVGVYEPVSIVWICIGVMFALCCILYVIILRIQNKTSDKKSYQSDASSINEKSMTVTIPPGVLGVKIQRTMHGTYIVVEKVFPGELRVGDEILAIDGDDIKKMKDIDVINRIKMRDDEIQVKIIRCELDKDEITKDYTTDDESSKSKSNDASRHLFDDDDSYNISIQVNL